MSNLDTLFSELESYGWKIQLSEEGKLYYKAVRRAAEQIDPDLVLRLKSCQGEILDRLRGGTPIKSRSVSSPIEPEAKLPADFSYTIVGSDEDLGPVLEAVARAERVGIDTETTGFDSLKDRIRLIQLATPDGVFVVDLFQFAHPKQSMKPLMDSLSGVELVGHNLQFDLRFLARLGLVPSSAFCTYLASQILHAGLFEANGSYLRHGLGDVSKRELGVVLNKDQQRSDWSKSVLSQDQLDYSAADVHYLIPLADRLRSGLKKASLSNTADLEMMALLGIVWAGPVSVDVQKWESLSDAASSRRIQLSRQMDQMVPNPRSLLGCWSWDSPSEVKEALSLVKVYVESTDDDSLAAIQHPLAALMRDYRVASKKVSTYGRGWLAEHAPDGTVLASWQQLGAKARMSCKDPNLQQIPRESEYRKCFVARPGYILVKADYSQIELRTAAVIAGEEAMLEAYRKGEDLHTLTASMVLGKKVQDVNKEDRQIAKSVNFGLLYGMGYRKLVVYALSNYGVSITEDQAQRYRDAFFRAYPKLAQWHMKVKGDMAYKMRKEDSSAVYEVRTLGGRRRLVPLAKKAADGTLYPNATEALNFPVQGTAADGMKAAIALLWRRRHEMPGSAPILFIHDEIVLEAPESQAVEARDWLTRTMVDGMQPFIPQVPVVVEASIGKTWGG